MAEKSRAQSPRSQALLADLGRRLRAGRQERGLSVAEAARRALVVIEEQYRMTRPDPDDDSRRARSNRATYELHDRAGEFTSILCTYQSFPGAPELLTGGSIFPAVQNLLLAARAQGLGACLTSWANYDGEALLREAVGVPDDHLLCAHVVVGWPRSPLGPVRRRPVDDVLALDHWDNTMKGTGR